MTQNEMDTIMWKVVLHMAFVISGVLFAVMDKIALNDRLMNKISDLS